MQARIKEIQDRSDYLKMAYQPKAEIASRAIIEDIPYLLVALREAQTKLKISDGNLIDRCGELRQLQSRNHDLELSIAAVRAANDAWKTIVTELREEIKQLKTVWQ